MSRLPDASASVHEREIACLPWHTQGQPHPPLVVCRGLVLPAIHPSAVLVIACIVTTHTITPSVECLLVLRTAPCLATHAPTSTSPRPPPRLPPPSSLYRSGYTSLGPTHATMPNHALRQKDGSYLPAWQLADGRMERAGR